MTAETPDKETAVLREYYSNNDYLSSPEGIMKLIAVLGCLASGVLFLAGGGCSGAAGLPAGGAAVALAGAALLALQLAASLLGAPLFAPHLWLYTNISDRKNLMPEPKARAINMRSEAFFVLSPVDVVGSAVLGSLLLLTGVLSVTLCELHNSVAYAHAPLAAGNAAVVVGSAVATYAAVTKRWDAARGPAWEPRRDPPLDVDV